VDEEFEEYDEVADALLSFAGQPPRRMLTASQPSPTAQSPHSAPISNGSRSGLSAKVTRGTTSATRGNNNGVSPRSDKSTAGGGGGGATAALGDTESPSNSPHTQRSAVESPSRAASSPESSLAQSGNNLTGGGTRILQSGILSEGPPGSTNSLPGHTHSVYPPPAFSKRTRAEESSPVAGEASAPEAKRSRSCVAGHASSGQPSPRSQTNSDGRSPLSGGGGGGGSGKASIMSLTGGKKGIMNDDHHHHHHHHPAAAAGAEGTLQTSRRTKKSDRPLPSSTSPEEHHKHAQDASGADDTHKSLDDRPPVPAPTPTATTTTTTPGPPNDAPADKADNDSLSAAKDCRDAVGPSPPPPPAAAPAPPAPAAADDDEDEDGEEGDDADDADEADEADEADDDNDDDDQMDVS